MASRPTIQSKDATRRPEPLRFEVRLRVYSGVLCVLVLGLLAALLFVLHLSVASVVSILVVVTLALLLRIVRCLTKDCLRNSAGAVRFLSLGCHIQDTEMSQQTACIV